MDILNSESEPIRLTSFVTGLITAVIGALIMYLQTNDWKAAAITALVAISGILGTAEAARGKVVSPASLERNTGKTIDQMT